MKMIRYSSTYILILAIVLIFTSCASLHLERCRVLPSADHDLFDTSSVTGTGLKTGTYNYQPVKCLKKADTVVTGGVLSIEFIDPASVMSGSKGAFNDYIRSTLKRADKLNTSGMSPFSVACIVRVSDKRNYIIDNKIEFTEIAESKLQGGDLDGFYRLCGTRFVDSTVFESGFAFVITYYMPEQDVEKFRNKIVYGRQSVSSDAVNLSILSGIEGYPVFFSVYGLSDSINIPVEFPLKQVKGNDIDIFIKKIIRSSLKSSSGRITSVEMKKWMDLPAVNRFMPVRKGYRFTEGSYDVVETLTHDIHDFLLFRINIGRYSTGEGRMKIENLSEKISWKNYYRCSWGVSEKAYLKPESERDCSDFIEGVKYFREMEIYNPSITQTVDDAGLENGVFSGLRLIDKSTVSGFDILSESDYRFKDKTLYKHIPEEIKPGQTMDISGKTFSSDCINNGSMKFVKSGVSGISAIRTDCYPSEFRKRDMAKRIFMFWKEFPAGEPYYRGNVEATVYSDELTDDFTITDEAADLARNDLNRFYKKFGTHYVSQVKGRRGIVYYFSDEHDRDGDINVIGYGISGSSILKDTGEQVSANSGDGCITSIVSKFLNRTSEDPLLHPSSVKDFFKSKDKFARVIEESASSVPVEVYLKPWSQYLVHKNIIRIDQTIPVSLISDRKNDTVNGKVLVHEPNGDIYDGFFSNGLRNGYGELTSADGSLYKGSWMGDLMHGRGMHRGVDGSVYNGDFMYGYFHGKGEKKESNGDIYSGDFYRGKESGNGVMRYNDGRIYRGEFTDGKPDGYGIMEHRDGRKDEGLFRKGEIYKSR